MENLWHDLQYGLRVMRTHRGVSFVAVAATLALGIGANTAIFSVVSAVLWRPLPFTDPDALVAVFESRPRENRDRNPASPADFLDWRSENQAFLGSA